MNDQAKLRTMLHVIVANLEALHTIGSGLSTRNYQRLVQCQEALRVVSLPNPHHPAVSKVRRESRLLLDQLAVVVEELSRVNSLDDLVSMLQSYFNLESVPDLMCVVSCTLIMLYERAQSMYDAIESPLHSGTWAPTDKDIPVTEARMLEWLNA